MLFGTCNVLYLSSGVPNPAGTLAGIGGALRARAVRKSIRVRSRSRSPCRARAEEQSEADQSTADDACDDQSGGDY